jgi:two-component system response regulator PilR (NtrC family)
MIAVEALKLLENYGWPGNVRELENVIERALALTSSDVLTSDDIPTHLLRGGTDSGPAVELPEAGIDLEVHLDSVRREMMAQALDRCDGVQTRAAELVGMSFRSFRYYAKKSGLTRDAVEESVTES